MHTLVRRYVKTAIVSLAIGLAIGVWLLVRRELYGRYATPHETSAHTRHKLSIRGIGWRQWTRVVDCEPGVIESGRKLVVPLNLGDSVTHHPKTRRDIGLPAYPPGR